MEAKKPIGWVLIVLGLGLVLWALWSSFQMFSGKTAAPEIFNKRSPGAGAGNIKSNGSGAIKRIFTRGFAPETSKSSFLVYICGHCHIWGRANRCHRGKASLRKK